MKIFKILSKHEFIFAETLDRFDHERFKAHAGFGAFGLFEDLLKGRVIFSQQFHDFVGLGVVITVVGVPRLEIFVDEQFENRQ